MNVGIFCGSNPGTRPAYRTAADALGETLARAGHGVVYGGAAVGLMGAVADGALRAGGHVVGVLPRFLAQNGRELGHPGLSELVITETLHERKALMAARAQAFIALPGGFGTLDELFEILTWAQLGLHASPILLLDIEGFFAPLQAMVDHMVESGFLRAAHRTLYARVATVAEVPLALTTFSAAPLPPKWVERS